MIRPSELVDLRKMTMVVLDDFVGLGIPTFYHLKPGARPCVKGWIVFREALKKYAPYPHHTRRDTDGGMNCKPTYGGDMSGERQPQLARREVPEFDDAFSCAGCDCEPLVARLDGDAAYPQVSRNVTHEFPWRMICRLDSVSRFE